MDNMATIQNANVTIGNQSPLPLMQQNDMGGDLIDQNLLNRNKQPSPVKLNAVAVDPKSYEA